MITNGATTAPFARTIEVITIDMPIGTKVHDLPLTRRERTRAALS